MNRVPKAYVLALFAVGVLASAGCVGTAETIGKQTSVNLQACGADDCHREVVDAQARSAHSEVDCMTCHEGTGEAHAKDPKKAIATIDWRIDACAGCHEGQATTYLYDDNAKVGPFGGSQRTPAQPKVDTFPSYNTIVAGHPFSRDYREEGAHAYVLQDHYETLRGKFDSCLQCKSTKIAYAWDTGKPVTVAKDAEIELAHTAAPGIEAKKVKIPAGTKITYATDKDTRAVRTKAVFPDGTTWTSPPAKSADATQTYNMIWAASVAAIKETWPYGSGCNHCHDPHTGGERLVRKAMLGVIEGDGGPTGSGGVNPYAKGSTKDWTAASKKDRQVLICAQCHVEYSCARSGVDGVVRDAFSWVKAADLHDLYIKQFGYTQDWKNALMGEPLIKSQHPEVELFWESTHYTVGASCVDCHMPEVRGANNRPFTSHWFTSPYKYRDEKTWTDFAEVTGVDPRSKSNPCASCHEDATDKGIAQQKAFFARQGEVEKLLARSVIEFAKLKEAKAAKKPIDEKAYAEALEAHRRAHVIWENIAVSENSMGFHNFEEAFLAMDEAEKQVRIALDREAKALSPR